MLFEFNKIRSAHTMKKNILTSAFLLLSALLFAQNTIDYSELKADAAFNESEGTFVLYNPQENTYQIYNPQRAKEPFSVHSTSKILWSIIGLEEHLIADENEVVTWDSIAYKPVPFWPEQWKQNQTVVTALKYSVNWYYMELMKQMTPEMVEKYLNNLDYKKGFHVEKVHYYGLTFLIEKSAIEQITFLQNFYTNKYKLSESTENIVKKGMLQESGDGYSLYYKTGLGQIKNGHAIGWVIGFIEKGDELYYFAMNVEDKDMNIAGKKRLEICLPLLRQLHLIE